MNIGMKIAHPDAQASVIGGQVLRHALRQRGDQNPLSPLRPRPDFTEKIIHLPLNGFHDDFRVHEARGTDDLLNDMLSGLVKFICGGCRRNIKPLLRESLVFFKHQRAVVQSGGQPETIIHQGFLPGPVAPVHPDGLGNRRMTLINDN